MIDLEIMAEFDKINERLDAILLKDGVIRANDFYKRLGDAAHKAIASGSREDLNVYLKMRISMTE